MPNSKGAPTPREVEKWNFFALNDWAAVVRAGNTTFKTQIDKARNHFGDVGQGWSGVTHDAAYERVDEDYTQARKVFYDIDDVPGMLEQAGSSLSSFKQVVLDKIADAAAIGLWVDDAWQIPDKEGVERQTIDDHQAAVRGALAELMNEIATHKQKLTANAELIRAAGDLFGSSINVDEAAAQGGRLGGQDGRAIALAAQNHDTGAFAGIVDNMPGYVLNDQERRALANGEEVSTVPAAVQDYYREFYRAAGKDGVLALDDYLSGQEKGGNTVAAAQRDNLANGIMLVGNDKVVSRGPDGKILAQGGYANLPADIRELVSGRVEDRVAAYGSPAQVRDRFAQQARFAELLGQANPGYTPGKEFGIELGRQGASIANYLNQVDRNMNGNLPSAFLDSDRALMDRAAQQYLTAADRNHESAYALLTGDGVTTDLSHGALGDTFKPDAYKPKEFADAVFRHDWPDQGKAAAGLFDWAGEHSHDQGMTGDHARQVLATLPNYFAPHDHNGTLLMDDGRPITDDVKDGVTTFSEISKSFANNPELATGLAKALAPNVDLFNLPGAVTDGHGGVTPVTTGVNGEQLSFGSNDGRRMLFLANLSDDGSLYLETARQLNQAEVTQGIVQGRDPDPLETAKYLANVDAHMNVGAQNAKIYLDSLKADEHNHHVQDQYEAKQQAGEFVKDLIGQSTDIAIDRVPGGAIVHGIVGDLRDSGLDQVIEAWNPEPDLKGVQYPDLYDSRSIADQGFKSYLEDANQRNGQSITRENERAYIGNYGGAYNDTVGSSLLTNTDQIKYWLTGGVGAPK
ncbi:hypothetical protein AB0L82_31210 [Nocardia sp. NPDC052001]|uniref:TPR repeat region-containing protein n=1 Tax=Nocardia sp. NPDC052001 TaxID=3154853 RepID=UPI003426E59F